MPVDLLIIGKMLSLALLIFLGLMLTLTLEKLEKKDRVIAGVCIVGMVACYQIWNWGL